jgi:hypothetical protein
MSKEHKHLGKVRDLKKDKLEEIQKNRFTQGMGMNTG